MSKTYHTRKAFEQRMRKIRQVRERLAEESSVTVLASLNQFDKGLTKAKTDLSRHPSGTRAAGLRRALRGRKAVKDFRDRFGVAEERSSRRVSAKPPSIPPDHGQRRGLRYTKATRFWLEF